MSPQTDALEALLADDWQAALSTLSELPSLDLQVLRDVCWRLLGATNKVLMGRGFCVCYGLSHYDNCPQRTFPL